VVDIHNGVLFSDKEEKEYVACRYMEELENFMQFKQPKVLPSLSQTIKNIMFFILSSMFLLLHKWRTGVWNRFCGGSGEVARKGVG
jgi:hypothetical protein